MGIEREQLRNIKIDMDYLNNPDGSVLIQMGNTKVICTAMIENRVPFFLRNQGVGWITAEYSMLPASTERRKVRDIARGQIDGRSQEIQRLIGRALRTTVDMSKIGERTIWIDCDVIQADGGTRTAAITGGFMAMAIAIDKLFKEGRIKENPILNFIAAVSVGVCKEGLILDMCYEEDHKAIVDMNLVMTEEKKFIEIQGTGEERSFTREELNGILDLAEKGIEELIQIQKTQLKNLKIFK